MNFISANLANSMNDLLMDQQAYFKMYKIDIQELIKASQKEKIYGYFSFNDNPIQKRLRELGVKFERIDDKFLLNSNRKDKLYVIRPIGYRIKDINDSIPKHVCIEVNVYETFNDSDIQ